MQVVGDTVTPQEEVQIGKPFTTQKENDVEYAPPSEEAENEPEPVAAAAMPIHRAKCSRPGGPGGMKAGVARMGLSK